MIINKKLFVDFIFGLFVFVFTITPNIALGASVYFSSGSKDIHVGDVFVVEARISSPEENINVIDGSILFNEETLEAQELSTGNSVFSIWAEAPTYNNEEGTIRFVGGVPEGFQSDSGLILKAIFLAKTEGKSELVFGNNLSAFLNNGKGTEINPEDQSIILTVTKAQSGEAARNEWSDFIKEDTSPPEFIEGIVSRDPSIFDNQYFVSFLATDDDSGVAYYEVKEGSSDFTRVESPYLLHDQLLEGEVQIKAVDKAGNEIIITPVTREPSPTVPYSIYITWILGVLLAFVLTRIIWKVIK